MSGRGAAGPPARTNCPRSPRRGRVDPQRLGRRRRLPPVPLRGGGTAFYSRSPRAVRFLLPGKPGRRSPHRRPCECGPVQQLPALDRRFARLRSPAGGRGPANPLDRSHRLQLDRATGRHRHHCDPDLAFAAGRPESSRGRRPDSVLQQPQTDRSRLSQLSRHLGKPAKISPMSRPGRARPDDRQDAGRGLQFAHQPDDLYGAERSVVGTLRQPPWVERLQRRGSELPARSSLALHRAEPEDFQMPARDGH